MNMYLGEGKWQGLAEAIKLMRPVYQVVWCSLSLTGSMDPPVSKECHLSPKDGEVTDVAAYSWEMACQGDLS